MRSVSRFLTRSMLVLALVSTSACDLFTASDRPNLRVSMLDTAVLRGSDVQVTIENRTNRSWFVNSVCNYGVERLVDGQWVGAYTYNCLATGVAGFASLTYEVPSLEPGETAVFLWTIPADAHLGTHRIRVRVLSDFDSGRGEYFFVTPQFEVAEVIGALK